MKNESSTSSRMPSLGLLDGRHEELIASLPNLAPKLAAVRLLEHLSSLPGLSASSQTLFYHIDSASRLCQLILEPIPFSGHIGFLQDLRALLNKPISTAVGDKIPELSSARGRLAVILAAEFGIRGQWEEVVSVIAQMIEERRPKIPERQDSDLLSPSIVESWKQNFSAFLDLLSDLDSSPSPTIHTPSPTTPRHPIQWPYHLLDPEKHVPKGSVLMILVDGDEIPEHYREGYLAALSVSVLVKKHRETGESVIRARDDKGEDLPLGDELKDLVREAIGHSLALLGPSAMGRTRTSRLDVEIRLRRPSPISEIKGRSLLLPLILVLSGQLGEQLNLSATMNPRPSIVWTGGTDDHGNITTVRSMNEKATRVAYSRASGFAFPAEHSEKVNKILGGNDHIGTLSAFPLSNVHNLIGDSRTISIRSRSLFVRALFDLKRRARPLGIAGSAAIGILLIGLAYAIPNLASWLDTTVVQARLTPDRGHIELVNSRDRVIREFRVETTASEYPTLGDVDGDGVPEIFHGSSSHDSVPSTLFCLDSEGQELWRFKGGFREDEPKPYPLENTFNSCAAFAHDLDRDGRNEVIAVFNHAPYYASQIAILTSEGHHVSSFWNPGNTIAAGFFTEGMPKMAFEDMDNDGYDEMLISGTNNSCDQAVFIVLDPRSIEGKGFRCNGEPGAPTWQTYVLFPYIPQLHVALGAPRLCGKGVKVRKLFERDTIRIDVAAQLSGRGEIGAFSYSLDFDLNVVHFHMSDEFVQWAVEAFEQGKVDFDVRSKEFRDTMMKIEVIAGPPELLLP